MPQAAWPCPNLACGPTPRAVEISSSFFPVASPVSRPLPFPVDSKQTADVFKSDRCPASQRSPGSVLCLPSLSATISPISCRSSQPQLSKPPTFLSRSSHAHPTPPIRLSRRQTDTPSLTKPSTSLRLASSSLRPFRLSRPTTGFFRSSFRAPHAPWRRPLLICPAAHHHA